MKLGWHVFIHSHDTRLAKHCQLVLPGCIMYVQIYGLAGHKILLNFVWLRCKSIKGIRVCTCHLFVVGVIVQKRFQGDVSIINLKLLL